MRAHLPCVSDAMRAHPRASATRCEHVLHVRQERDASASSMRQRRDASASSCVSDATRARLARASGT
ncbi:hypothetical protein RI054_33g130000 [Pseudoscourfieldia marina]